ncbi:RagB/SusD family nutrient uptake outer membrane protein [Pedobacter jejuensis]|uniref:RagB/SusD family nutrient uptake outer membrane protein n=1 Tax=Pedobacter jejuensis TaxID=1268550 RepID=A0A3N0BYT1_9SPHI|nr:RagB/SusD family nutrient uptake outer membrane protein [Pedobacter jejuensis]RNL54750.1 RagB/SusD family nutrient uptake outer membrane protein [Pedobacter jejuensis]
MKKITIILLICIAAIACKKSTFLDNKSNNALNEETVFTDSVNAISFLTRVYMEIGYSYDKDRYEAGSTEQATDDSEYVNLNPARRPLILYGSTYTADNTTVFNETWVLPYQNIRRLNLFLSKMPVMPFKEVTKKRLIAEAKMLRAWYYYNLLITFGGVPIVGETLFPGDEIITVPRSTFSNCVDYVVKELDAAAADLPIDQMGNDYGRVTKGAALAVKAKILLFAASPLFNGNTWPSVPGGTKTPERIAVAGYPNFDVMRWQKVLDAAEAVIALGYTLNVENANPNPGYGFYNMFLQRRNKEHIFFVNQPPNRDFETFYLPQTRSGNRSGNPTQNVVDVFPMVDGKSITESPLYNPQDPYKNRDPRFGYSIIFNQALWFSTSTNTKIAVNTYVGAPTDGFYQDAGTSGSSGYFCRKTLDEGLTGNSGTTNRNWILIRYAEILLIKAEALNEIGRTADAYGPIRELRSRAGINAGTDANYGMKIGMTQTEMRSFVQNERRIELYNEDKRWDDVRRWKLAETFFNGYNKLMSPTRVTISPQFPTGYKYDIVNSLRLHVFKERNYLLPMQIGEMLKNTALIQTPGW